MKREERWYRQVTSFPYKKKWSTWPSQNPLISLLKHKLLPTFVMQKGHSLYMWKPIRSLPNPCANSSTESHSTYLCQCALSQVASCIPYHFLIQKLIHLIVPSNAMLRPMLAPFRWLVPNASAKSYLSFLALIKYPLPLNKITQITRVISPWE